MSVELLGANVVLTAQQFNPSIVSQLWLVRNEIVPEDQFGDGCIFSDMVANVRTQDFELLLIPPRLQFSPNMQIERKQEVIESVLGRFVQQLPETPYTALGFNFVWQMRPDHATVDELCRRLFRVADGPIHRFFEVGNGLFGSYMSKDSLGFRLKLSARPAFFEQPRDGIADFISFEFNYHLVAPAANAPARIVEMLGQWNNAESESSQIARSAEG